MILGIDHIDLRVQDIDAAIRFYCEGPGLTLKRRNEHNGIAITPDGAILEISTGAGEWDAGGITHVCYNTYDADAGFGGRPGEDGKGPDFSSFMAPYNINCLGAMRLMFNQLQPMGYTFRLFHPGWVRSTKITRIEEQGSFGEPQGKFWPWESAKAGSSLRGISPGTGATSRNPISIPMRTGWCCGTGWA